MKDQDYIRAAVKLAEGFVLAPDGQSVHLPQIGSFVMDNADCPLEGWPQSIKDALAAQLVRQVDAAANKYFVQSRDTWTIVLRWQDYDKAAGHNVVSHSEGPDRTMNTIKAIVDSGVL